MKKMLIFISGAQTTVQELRTDTPRGKVENVLFDARLQLRKLTICNLNLDVYFLRTSRTMSVSLHITQVRLVCLIGADRSLSSKYSYILRQS